MIDTGLSLYHEGYRIGGTTRPQRFIKMGEVCRVPEHNKALMDEWFRASDIRCLLGSGRLFPALRQDERAVLYRRELVRHSCLLVRSTVTSAANTAAVQTRREAAALHRPVAARPLQQAGQSD